MRIARTPRTTRSIVGALALAVVLLPACGGDDGDAASEGTSAAPTGTDAPDSSDASAASDAPVVSDPPVSAEAPAASDVPVGEDAVERVVSLSPTHTEMLFAIGADDVLVAVDDQSNHPAEAMELPHDLSGFEPNIEAIAGYQPDLVVMGGDFTGLGEQLDAVGIPWWDGPAALTLDDTYAQIEALGALTGHDADAVELVAGMRSEIDQLVADTPRSDPPLEVYHELDPSLYSADSTTFIGALYGMLGLHNIADRTEGDFGGYPQLNAEFIVSADPDLVFLADTLCCGESAATVAARPGWDGIAAVRNGGVVEMDDDIASRWGPRVVDYLRAVSEAVQAAGPPA